MTTETFNQIAEATAAADAWLVDSARTRERIGNAASDNMRFGFIEGYQVARRRGDARSPSYEALQLIAQSVCGALDRAGITECDDPGEAIDVMRGRLEARIAAFEAQGAQQQAGAPRPIDTAPRDGTMVRLLVEFEAHQTVDDSTGTAWTIGANTNDLDPDQPAEWQFAGWCWTHDHFTEGKGTPIGWLPLVDDAQPAASAVAPVMTFSLGEAIALLQTFGGANCSMSVQHWDATPRAGDEDPPRAGKHAWCTDYPEEGASWLGEHDPSSETHEGWDAKPPAISEQVAKQVAGIASDLPLDVEEQIARDDAAWALAKRAESFGAERDEDDDSTWWVLRIGQFQDLAQSIRDEVAASMALPEWFDDVKRCLDDVATQQRAHGYGDSRMVQLVARMSAWRAAAPVAPGESSAPAAPTADRALTAPTNGGAAEAESSLRDWGGR